jgi:hypothetical protein
VVELDRDGTVGKPRRHSTLDQINSLLSATEGGVSADALDRDDRRPVESVLGGEQPVIDAAVHANG